jgi:hypothetical protein
MTSYSIAVFEGKVGKRLMLNITSTTPEMSSTNSYSSQSTRKRASPQPSLNKSEKIARTEENFPPERTSQSIRRVSPPLSKGRLSNFIYVLLLLTALLGTFYTYRLTQHKAEVGGWWNLLLGRTSQQYNAQHPPVVTATPVANKGASKGSHHDVEDKINALAEALGMPSNELASAIAGAVRAYVPPATLTSLAAKQTGDAVHVLLGETGEVEVEKKQEQPNMMDGIVHGMESFVGMDEP